MNVTLSATDQMSPTLKSIITNLQALTNELKIVDSGITTVQGKFRAQAFGATNLFPTQQVTAFSAGLNQLGIDMNKVQSSVTPTVSKFQQFGQVLLQNGTAFGVAGASAFGLFNAIDNLEKVQLRAETATLRASTAQTTLAAAEKTLAEAKASGTATTEQLSLLEQKVADARERVSVTTQRAAIFQQDYTEAIAGLALQVGPQAIAVAGSLGTVYTTLSTTFQKQGGILNALKTSVTGLMGSFSASTASVGVYTGAITTMTTAEEAATVATRGLSNAMKGLLIASGVGAILAIGSAIFEMSADMAESAKQTEVFNAKLEESSLAVDEFGNLTAESLAKLPAGFLELTKVMDQISATSTATAEKYGQNLVFIVDQTVVSLSEAGAKAAEVQKQQLENMVTLQNAQLAKLQTTRKGIVQGIEQQGALGFDTTSLKTDLKNIDTQINQLTGDINGNKDAIAALTPITDQWANGLGKGATAAQVGAFKMKEWEKQQIASKIAMLQELDTIRTFATAHNITIPAAFLKSTDAALKYVAAQLGIGPAIDETNKAAEEAAQKRAQEVAVIEATTQAYAGLTEVQGLSVGQMEGINKVMGEIVQPMNDIMVANQQIADTNAAATQSWFDQVAAIAANAEASINLNAIYEETFTAFAMQEAARVKGIDTAAKFVTATELEATSTQATTAALEEYVTTTLGIVIPPGIEATLPLLQAIIKEYAAAGTAAGTLAKAMNEQMAPAFASIADALGAESINKMRKAVKDLPGFEDFSKQAQKDLLAMDKMLFQAGKRFEEFGTDVHQAMLGISTDTISGKGLANLMEQLNKDFDSFAKIDTSGITKAFDPLFNMLDQLTGTQARTVFPKFQEMIKDIQTAFSSGNTIDAQEAVDIIKQNIDVLKQFPGVFDAIKASLPPDVAAEVDKLEASMGKLGSTWSDLIKLAQPGQKKGFGTEGSTGFVDLGKEPEKGAPEVPGPVKATDFDTKKQAIIDEVTKMWETNIIPPAMIPAPDDTIFTPAMTTIPTTATTTFVSTFNAGFGGGGEGGGSGLLIPAPNPTAFIAGLAGLAVSAAQTAAFINAAFATTLVIPAPDTTAFVASMNTLLLIPGDFINRWNEAFAAGLIIPAPDLTEFADGLVTALEMVADFVTGAAEMILLIPEAFVPIAEIAQEVFDAVVEIATTAIDDVVTATDDLITAFEDVASAGEQAGSDVASAMEEIGSAASSATSEVDALTNALNSIPTDITVTITVNATGSGLQFLAGGYHGIVDEPTLFVVGEAGPERVDVEPAAGNMNPMFAAARGEPYGIETLEQSRVNTNLPGPYVPPPPMVTQPPSQSMTAHITIPVYLDGRHIDTRQSQRFIRDLGAIIS